MSALTNDAFKRNLNNTLALIGILAIGVGASIAITYVINSDALAPFRASNSPFALREGVILQEGFKLRNYQKDRLIVEADVDRAVVLDDWSIVQLTDITNGKFTTEEGQKITFTAPAATYGNFSKALIATGGVTFKSKDFDLKAQGFTYDNKTKTVTFDGPVTGKLDKGDVVANNVTINIDTKELKAQQTNWKGLLALQEAPQKKKSVWNISVGELSYKGGVSTWINARGNDEDMIVRSDRMVYDKEKDVVNATGNVKYWGTDANLVCDQIIIDRRTGKATLTALPGKRVNMLVKPEDQAKPAEEEIPPLVPVVPDEILRSRPLPPLDDQEKDRRSMIRDTETLRKYPIAIIGDKIEYFYKRGSRQGTITGTPYARQQLPGMEWRELFADSAKYDGEAELLTLLSKADQRNVRVRNSIGDDLLGKVVTVSTKKDDDTMTGQSITGNIIPNDDDDDAGNSGSTTGGR